MHRRPAPLNLKENSVEVAIKPIHPHSLIKDSFESSINLTCMFLECGGQLLHANIRRTSMYDHKISKKISILLIWFRKVDEM